MQYILTEKQKDLARWLVGEVRAGRLSESFTISESAVDPSGLIGNGGVDKDRLIAELNSGQTEALREAKLLLVSTREKKAGTLVVHYRTFTLTATAYDAVDSNFGAATLEKQPSSNNEILDNAELTKLPPTFQQALAIRCALRAAPFLGHRGLFEYWKDKATTRHHVESIEHALQAGLINSTDNSSRTDELRIAVAVASRAAAAAAAQANATDPRAQDTIRLLAAAADAGSFEKVAEVLTSLWQRLQVYPETSEAARRDVGRLVELSRQPMNWPPPDFFREPLWWERKPDRWEQDVAGWISALEAVGLAGFSAKFLKWSRVGMQPGDVGMAIQELISWSERYREESESSGRNERAEPQNGEQADQDTSQPQSTTGTVDQSFVPLPGDEDQADAGGGSPVFTFSKLGDQVLQRALDYSSRRNGKHVSTSCLLFALAEGAGQQNDTCRFLRDRLDHAGSYRDEFTRFLSERGITNSSGVASGTLLGQVSKNTLGILQDAQAIACRVAKNSSEIHQRQLLAAILVENPNRREPFAWSRLKRLNVDLAQLRTDFLKYVELYVHGEDLKEWRTILTRGLDPNADRTVRIGATNHFLRNATGDEIVLDVHGYANVLARLFRGSDDKDLCIAIFGPWGRGKTFLVDCFVEKLRAGNTANERRYEVVRFSAWKFPSRPEVWIHLYESVFRELGEEGWWRSLAHVVRAGIVRHGVGKLFAIWSALLLTALPKGWLLEGADTYFRKIFYAIDGSLALGALTFAVLFTYKLWRTKDTLERSFLRVARHIEKLGLQATIGDDLRALLKGWVDARPPTARDWKLYWGCIAALVGLVYWRAHPAWELGLVLSIFIVVVGGLIHVAFATASPSPNRLLLVVDDLDRCHPDHLLAVMESIKLLLEDEEISSRIQVVMLIEEDVLKHALWNKYEYLTKKVAQDELKTDYDGDRIVRENFEKLFTAHLRLSPLTIDEIREVVLAFGGSALDETSSEKAPEARVQPSPPPEHEESPPHEPSDSKTPRLNSAARTDESAPPPAARPEPIPRAARTLQTDDRRAISSDEKQTILAALVEIYGKKHTELGPRALRGFMFRYQLARLILQELGHHEWSPEGLARTIASRQQRRTPAVVKVAMQAQVEAVANQVA